MSEAADPAEVEYDKDIGKWRFKPRGLHITWGSDSRYWKMPEKGTDGPAELLNVCWLEISSSTSEPLSKGKRYALSFKISFTKPKSGWKNAPVFMLAKVGKKGIAKWAKINLENMSFGNIIEIPDGKLQFEVPIKTEDSRLYFGLYELWTGGWKEGLQIHEAVVEEMPD